MTLMYIEITWMLLGSTFVFMNPIFKCDFSDSELTEADACDNVKRCSIGTIFLIQSMTSLSLHMLNSIARIKLTEI